MSSKNPFDVFDELFGGLYNNPYNPYDSPYKPYRSKGKIIKDIMNRAFEGLDKADMKEGIEATITLRKGDRYYEVQIKDITDSIKKDDDEIISIQFVEKKDDEDYDKATEC